MSVHQMLTKPLMLQSDERILLNPNLPQNDVTLAAISETAGESIKKLHSLDISTVGTVPHEKLSVSVNSHSDIRMLHIETNKLFCFKEETDKYRQLANFTVFSINETMGLKYPDDVRLNCAVIGKNIICNTKTISKEILKYADENGFNIINCNQGYSKCSICIIDDNSIITDDPSIYKSAQFFLNDILFISKGSIGLKGADYGFIGGCTGKLGKNKIAINGRIESHNDHNEIIDFLEQHQMECIELTNNKLEDIGGIIPLAERIH